MFLHCAFLYVITILGGKGKVLLMPQRTDPCRQDTWGIQNPQEHLPMRYQVQYHPRYSLSPRHTPSRKGHIHIS